MELKQISEGVIAKSLWKMITRGQGQEHMRIRTSIRSIKETKQLKRSGIKYLTKLKERSLDKESIQLKNKLILPWLMAVFLAKTTKKRRYAA